MNHDLHNEQVKDLNEYILQKLCVQMMAKLLFECTNLYESSPNVSSLRAFVTDVFRLSHWGPQCNTWLFAYFNRVNTTGSGCIDRLRGRRGPDAARQTTSLMLPFQRSEPSKRIAKPCVKCNPLFIATETNLNCLRIAPGTSLLRGWCMYSDCGPLTRYTCERLIV